MADPIQVLRHYLTLEAPMYARAPAKEALDQVEALVEAAHAVVYRHNRTGVERTYREQDEDLAAALRPFKEEK